MVSDKDAAAPAALERDPLKFLLDVMQGRIDPTSAQIRAAEAALPYKHVKRVDGGKKDEQLEKAKEVAKGRFGTAEAPKLVSSR